METTCRFERNMIDTSFKLPPQALPDTNCFLPVSALGFCRHHYNYLRRIGSPVLTEARNARNALLRATCKAVELDDTQCFHPVHTAKGYCEMHYRRIRTHGNPQTVLKPGPKPKLA